MQGLRLLQLEKHLTLEVEENRVDDVKRLDSLDQPDQVQIVIQFLLPFLVIIVPLLGALSLHLT